MKKIISKLQEGPKSINQIAHKDLNWRTADKYLKQLEELNIVTKRKSGNSIIYYYYDKETFFNIPLNKEKKLLVGGKTLGVISDPKYYANLDTLKDWTMAEQRYKIIYPCAE